jgi:hypothetical protein
MGRFWGRTWLWACIRPIILRTPLTLELYPRGHQHSLSFWNFQLSDASLYWWESILKNSKVPHEKHGRNHDAFQVSVSLSKHKNDMILFTSRRINWLKEEEKKKKDIPILLTACENWNNIKHINDKRIWYMKTKWQQKQTTKEPHVTCGTTTREASKQLNCMLKTLNHYNKNNNKRNAC